MRLATAILSFGAFAWAQSPPDLLKRGEEVFARSCATGYCHGPKGGPGGAPRLARRGFDQAFLVNTVSRGVPGTAMPPFADSLPRPDLTAVLVYVASLNGIAVPGINLPTASTRPALTGDAARGAQLFSDAVRGFARCSTCHDASGSRPSVVAPMEKVPADVAALKALTTPDVRTATLDGESMPALVVSEGKERVVFYDLTSLPPVQRTADAKAVKFANGSRWQHPSVTSAYTDSELEVILAYLRATLLP